MPLFNDARGLFGRMKADAESRAAAEAQAARPRGPLTRVLLALTLVAGLFAAGMFAYGLYRFPDAPLRPTATGYVNKSGQPRSQADYDAFVRWEKTMFLAFPAAFALGIASAIADRRGRGA